jgi:uncharacterized protein YndB with AHSA1/START domain
LPRAQQNGTVAQMKFVAWFSGIIVALVAIGYGIGMLIPETQSHTRTITVKQAPEKVFAVLADVERMPEWNEGLEKVETIPPIDGHEASRHTFTGNLAMTIVTTESHPPSHLVRKMGDDDGPFVGTWTYHITHAAGGSDVALTEESQVRNPFTRLMMKLMGATKYMDQHLTGLARHFGETAQIR